MSGKKYGECCFLHPKVCKQLLFKGKCSSKECKKYHPKMCYNSINTGKCFNKNCGYWHLKKTLRDPPVISHNDNEVNVQEETSNTCNHTDRTPDGRNVSRSSSEEVTFLEAIRMMKEEMSVWQQSVLLHMNTVLNKFQNNFYNQPPLMNQASHYSQSQ